MAEKESNQKICIRNLAEDELSKWLDFLCDEIFPGDPRENVEGIWYDDAEKDLRGVFVSVNPDNSIVASVKVCCTMMTVKDQKVLAGIISGVGTKKEYRGCGITGQLWAACNKYMEDREVNIAHLYSKPDTLDYYLHLGFRCSDKHPDESFYRMYRVIQPFELGNIHISTTEEFIDLERFLSAR